MTSQQTASSPTRLPIGLLLGALLLGCSQQAFALAAPDGPYIDLQGGGSLMPTLTSSIFPTLPFPIVQPVARMHFKVGYMLGGSLGYKYSSFRGEYQFNWHTIPHWNISQQPIGGSTVYLNNMFNALYDFDSLEREHDVDDFVPYVGIGIGQAHVRRNFTAFQPNLVATDNVLAYQGIIGIQYNADDVTTLALDFRYLATNNANNTFNDSLKLYTVALSVTQHMDSIFDIVSLFTLNYDY